MDKRRAAQETRERIRRQMMRAFKDKRSRKERAAGELLARRFRKEREGLLRNGRYAELSAEAKIHRVVGTVRWFPTNTFPWQRFRKLPDAQLLEPTPLWDQTYRQVRRIRCSGAIREIDIEFDRTKHWAAPFRVTLIPRRDGVQFDDLRAVLELLPNFKFVTIECAVDLPIGSVVDLEYVRRLGLFGKIRPRSIGVDPLRDTWGSRKSGIFVRIYARFPTDALRVEFELHARFLRHHGLNDLEDLRRLAQILPGRHIFFGRFDERKLDKELRRRGFDAQRRKSVLNQVQDKELLWDAMRYLRRRVRLTNTRRLVVPLGVNQIVRASLEKWSEEWHTALPRSPK